MWRFLRGQSKLMPRGVSSWLLTRETLLPMKLLAFRVIHQYGDLLLSYLCKELCTGGQASLRVHRSASSVRLSLKLVSVPRCPSLLTRFVARCFSFGFTPQIQYRHFLYQSHLLVIVTCFPAAGLVAISSALIAGNFIIERDPTGEIRRI